MDEGAPPRGRRGAPYTISKGPELANPLDPNSEPTGNTIYVLDEYDQSPAGVPRHWQDAIDNWSDLGAIVEWSKNAKVANAHSGTAVQGLW